MLSALLVLAGIILFIMILVSDTGFNIIAAIMQLGMLAAFFYIFKSVAGL